MLDKDAIGLNKKLLSKKSKKFFCMDCLAAHIDISLEDLYEKINEFKDQGCTLFF
jgi:biotin operon repressor